jgi:hypothetical protein
VRTESPARAFPVKMRVGKTYVNARITYACPKEGTYTVVATTVHKGAGFFELQVTEK